MPRRSTRSDPEGIRGQLVQLLANFEAELRLPDLRHKVQALAPAHHFLRDLGSSLIPGDDADSGRDRILLYLRQYSRTRIAGDELMVVGGIGDWARRVRELRVELGWAIATGASLKEMAAEGDLEGIGLDFTGIKPDEYVLLSDVQDREAAHRWNVANEIRKRPGVAVKDKLLAFFQANVGQAVTGEELRYLARDRKEWARRVRQLRTENGWPIVTRNTGRPDLPVGVYVLELNRKSPDHSRKITDAVRATALQRDNFTCQDCGWTQEKWNRADARILELHHLEHHARGGANAANNLLTLCNVCHDGRHRSAPESVSNS